jgi:hypothetical protein
MMDEYPFERIFRPFSAIPRRSSYWQVVGAGPWIIEDDQSEPSRLPTDREVARDFRMIGRQPDKPWTWAWPESAR